jgi:hypothetical protein
LKVIEVELIESDLLVGSNAVIQLRAEGCYKITICNVGTFPGSATQLSFPITSSIKSIEISFHGCNSTEKRDLRFRVAAFSLLTCVKPSNRLPRLAERNHRLKAVRIKLVARSSSIKARLGLDQPTVLLEKFDLENYRNA